MKSYWLLCVTLISDVTLDHFEDSIEDPTIHECPVGEFPVTYKIVEQGSKRGKVKLIDSNGYTYNIKSRGVNVVAVFGKAQSKSLQGIGDRTRQ